MRAHARLIRVRIAVHGAFRAERLRAAQALFAGAAAVVLVAPADTVTLLQVANICTELFDNAGTFVTERDSGGFVVEVGAAEAGVGDFNEDLAGLDFAGGFGFDDRALLGAFVRGELDHGV